MCWFDLCFYITRSEDICDLCKWWPDFYILFMCMRVVFILSVHTGIGIQRVAVAGDRCLEVYICGCIVYLSARFMYVYVFIYLSKRGGWWCPACSEFRQHLIITVTLPCMHCFTCNLQSSMVNIWRWAAVVCVYNYPCRISVLIPLHLQIRLSQVEYARTHIDIILAGRILPPSRSPISPTLSPDVLIYVFLMYR